MTSRFCLLGVLAVTTLLAITAANGGHPAQTGFVGYNVEFNIISDLQPYVLAQRRTDFRKFMQFVELREARGAYTTTPWCADINGNWLAVDPEKNGSLATCNPAGPYSMSLKNNKIKSRTRSEGHCTKLYEVNCDLKSYWRNLYTDHAHAFDPSTASCYETLEWYNNLALIESMGYFTTPWCLTRVTGKYREVIVESYEDALKCDLDAPLSWSFHVLQRATEMPPGMMQWIVQLIMPDSESEPLFLLRKHYMVKIINQVLAMNASVALTEQRWRAARIYGSPVRNGFTLCSGLQDPLDTND